MHARTGPVDLDLYVITVAHGNPVSEARDVTKSKFLIRSQQVLPPFKMALKLPPPQPMNFRNEAGQLADKWKSWRETVTLYTDLAMQDKPEKEKCQTILYLIGEEGRKIYHTWQIPEEERDKVAPLLERFTNYCTPKANITLERYKFNTTSQAEGESVEEYATKLRKLSKNCNYGKLEDELVRDRLIVGLRDNSLKERLLRESTLTLDTALQMCKIEEISKSGMGLLDSQHRMSVQTLQRKKSSPSPKVYNPSTKHKPKNRSSLKTQPKKFCTNCGGSPHPFLQCPARNQTCNYCKKLHHFKKVCRKLKHNQTYEITMGDNSTEEEEEEQYSCAFETIKLNKSDSEAFATVKVKLPEWSKATLKAKIDTGSQGNALPLRLYRKMFPSQVDKDGTPTDLTQSEVKLTGYGGHQIRQFGTCSIECSYKDKTECATFYVTEDKGSAILGLPTLQALGMISLNYGIEQKSNSRTDHIRNKEDLISKYPETFRGIGKFEGQYHIHTSKDVPPVIHPQRKVPIQIKAKIKEELKEMRENGIIEKIQEGQPTQWVNSLVYRTKPNGSLRLCLDPKDLNKAILREHYTTPTLEEILPSLSGAQYFSILDAKCGYWNVELDEESSYLTTFNSPEGRFRFLRMPFGLRMSQDIFQKKIDQTFEGCQGVIGIADDIVVFGKTEQEHDQNLHEMIKRCVETGLKLNPKKCRIKQKQIKFYGVIITQDGVKPDPSKVAAIRNMKAPENEKELQSFLGLATYMGHFIQNLSTLTAPLRELLTKSNKFEWSPSHEEAFQRIKNAITEEVTLAYFDAKKEITVQVDASMKALGATLMQDGKPVVFASKTLTDQETRYANIERELLAVVYGCERFHTYLYGQEFTVVSDHKPLQSIHLKHLKAAPPRLQRMLLRLQPYTFTIKYIPGKDMCIADALSRLSVSDEETRPLETQHIKIHEILPQFSDNYIHRITENTKTDTELNALKETIYNGWPENIKDVPQLCRPYWNYRDEISIEDGVLMKGYRIIIPQNMKLEVLNKLHEPHLGLEKTKLRARESVFWKDINKDIENIVRKCETCQKHQSGQQKEPLIQTEIPPRPWHTIGTDLFYLKGEEYLLISDYYSKFPFVRKIPKNQSTSHKIVTLTKQIFSEQGIPEVVRSDNGPHFSGSPYRKFSEEYNFRHETSSPHYPRSNGYIESQVKLVKRTLAKALESDLDPYKAILALRTTPIDNKLPSPARILFGRQIEDSLPRKIQRQQNAEEIQTYLQQRQETQKFYHDKNAKQLPPLSNNQPVTIRNPINKKWEPATIHPQGTGTPRAETPRSYIVRTAEGQIFRRNRVHMRPSSSPKSAPPFCKSPHQTALDLQQEQTLTVPTPNVSRTSQPTPHRPRETTRSPTALPTRRSQRTITAPKRLDL